ncbi:MAG: DUF1080 domain-containing protein [Cytophagia bacterium]|nr:MAG: DUF1080 domain-containing protein [Cytophagales bacterium]TAG36037.1 MAG: DUF1080 domain-containing protein [Cytophagia bacterium]TAG72243.1 MAG: DUF1080 domain-containing protein [Runella slithyformis]TAG77716.1 MAG: DUF1080 domain-containing protein [Cytophagales bacterium]
MKSRSLALLMAISIVTLTSGTPPKKWKTLFDGKSFAGWHNYLKKDVSSKWKIEDGAMVLAEKGAGDLVTDQEFADFELELEWKIAPGGNSGIFFGVFEDAQYKTPYMTGPEIQVLDDAKHPDSFEGKAGNHKAGSLYDMLPPSDLTAIKPADEWNKARFVLQKGRATHYLNGKKIVEYPISGPEWDAMVAGSKFKGWGGFGKYNAKGKIGLQDHGDKVSFRNIRIREM